VQGGVPKVNHFTERHARSRPITPEAEAMSKALKKAGFTFVGPTICYAFMQASVAWSWTTPTTCDRYAELGQTPVRMLATLEPCGRRLVLGQRRSNAVFVLNGNPLWKS
jgi:hypothetical protein